MRMTRKQMEEAYPMKCIGLDNVKYEGDDGITVESGEVIYTDKTMDELLELQVETNGKIVAFYTGGDCGLDSGIVEVFDEVDISA